MGLGAERDVADGADRVRGAGDDAEASATAGERCSSHTEVVALRGECFVEAECGALQRARIAGLESGANGVLTPRGGEGDGDVVVGEQGRDVVADAGGGLHAGEAALGGLRAAEAVAGLRCGERLCVAVDADGLDALAGGFGDGPLREIATRGAHIDACGVERARDAIPEELGEIA